MVLGSLTFPKFRTLEKLEAQGRKGLDLFLDRSQHRSLDIFFVVLHQATFVEIKRVIDDSGKHADVEDISWIGGF